MSERRQPRQFVLDALGVDAATAIHLAELVPLHDGQRPIGVSSQKRVLQFFATFRSDSCWLSIPEIAKRIAMDKDHTRRTIRALVDADLIIESGPRNRRTRANHWTEIGRRVCRAPTLKSTADEPGTTARFATAAAAGALPGSTGQSAFNCPDATGHYCPDEPGTGARIIERRIQSTSSSSESAADDDDEVLNDCGSAAPDPWGDVDDALRSAGVMMRSDAIAAAKGKGLTPAAVADAAYVVKHYRPTGSDPGLEPGALFFWIDCGDWPGKRSAPVPTAAELRERIAFDERRQAEADRIRDEVNAEAAAHHPPPEPWKVFGKIRLLLKHAGLLDLATDDEREAWPRYREHLDRRREQGTATTGPRVDALERDGKREREAAAVEPVSELPPSRSATPAADDDLSAAAAALSGRTPTPLDAPGRDATCRHGLDRQTESGGRVTEPSIAASVTELPACRDPPPKRQAVSEPRIRHPPRSIGSTMNDRRNELLRQLEAEAAG